MAPIAFDWHMYLAAGVFFSVLIVVAFDWVPMMVASLAGTAILYLSGTIGTTERLAARGSSDPVLCLFIGGMIIARALAPTGVFSILGRKIVELSRGEGWRLLVYIVLLIAPICMFLPNATVVILLAPVIIEAARRFKIDPVPLMLLAVFTANSSGLLSLVGDPATFIVANSAQMTFVDYLQRMTLGGVVSLLCVVALLPVLFRDIWVRRLDISSGVGSTGGATHGIAPTELPGNAGASDNAKMPDGKADATLPDGEANAAVSDSAATAAAPNKINNPVALVLLLVTMGLMVLFFVIGDQLPKPMAPQLSALSFAIIALLVVHFTKLDSVTSVIKDIDWETLIFFGSIFVIVQSLESTGFINVLGSTVAHSLGKNTLAASLTMLAGVGFCSGLIPNIPLVAALVPFLKTFVVTSGLTSSMALAEGVRALPAETMVFFYAVMFGGTLGGNMTLLGASSNVVACGICARAGFRVTFMRFLKYGVPVTVCHLTASAFYIMAVLWLQGK